MGGPIVRTGTTPKFWQNWDQVFAGKKKSSKSAAKPAAGKAAKSAKASKKSSAKPVAAKKAKAVARGGKKK